MVVFIILPEGNGITLRPYIYFCEPFRPQVSMPALKEHIYGSRSVTAEAQHSIMHALFLVIRSKPSKCSENLQQGLKIFNRLFDEYFKATMEV